VRAPLRKNTGFTHFLRAFGWSLAGLRAAFRHEAAFRQEVALMAVLLPASLWLGRGALERVALIVPCFVVLVAELVNSAIEAVVDRFGGGRHELAGRAKDMGSAAVFLSLVLLAVVWCLVLIERFSLT